MDVKHELIKIEVQTCYDEIKHYNELLEKLRKDCNHPETEKVNYQTRPGQTFPGTEVCSICGEVISWPDWDVCLDPSLYD